MSMLQPWRRRHQATEDLDANLPPKAIAQRALLKRLLEEFGVGRYLKGPAPLGRNCGDQIGANFLGCETHCGNINEKPAAEAAFSFAWNSGV